MHHWLLYDGRPNAGNDSDRCVSLGWSRNTECISFEEGNLLRGVCGLSGLSTHGGGCCMIGLCPNVDSAFGIGAELRGISYDFPAPYAKVMTGTEKWTSNLHFIRTTNVPDVQVRPQGVGEHITPGQWNS